MVSEQNNHSNRNVVKRGITGLYKFRMEYGKPGGVKLSVTFDALNRISGIHRALFSSFLGVMVKSAAGKMARSKCLYSHTMGRGRYAHVKEQMIEKKKEIEPDEEPSRGTLWLKGRVNKDGDYPDDEIRSVGDKLKETKDKIK
ncbi:retrovirus-related pol polyprotein from transposon TNT 1-94, partial [Tanacetum coccineum]